MKKERAIMVAIVIVLAFLFVGNLVINKQILSGNVASEINSQSLVSHYYSFDGVDDYLEILDSDSLDIGNVSDFTISVWINHTYSNATNWRDTIVSKYRTQLPSNSYDLYMRGNKDNVNSNKILFTFGNGNDYGVQLTTAETYNDNLWHHVVAIVDRDVGVKLYIDGELNLEKNVSTINWDNSNTNSLGIGGSFGEKHFFNGSIDDIKIMSSTLSDYQVKEIYNSGAEDHGLKKVNLGQKSISSPSWDSSSNWDIIDSFSDEFEGDNVNLGKWNNTVSPWGNFRWKSSNTLQKNGFLNLTMRYDKYLGKPFDSNYSSGILKTRESTLYGSFEARIKSAGLYPGVSPAFWVWYSDINNGEWTELDIVELTQGENFRRIDAAAHVFMSPNLEFKSCVSDSDCSSLGPSVNCRYKKCMIRYHGKFYSDFDPRDDFHNYGMEWNSKEIRWYVDGVEIYKLDNNHWDQPLFMALSLGLRNPYRFEGVSSSEGFPTSMQVDWVRVWKSDENVILDMDFESDDLGNDIVFDNSIFGNFGINHGADLLFVKRNLYCGDGTCNNGETCSSCQGDCGICRSVPTLNRGTGGSCSEKWECSNWSNILDECGTRTCEDKRCGRKNRNETKNCPVLFDENITRGDAQDKIQNNFSFQYDDRTYMVKVIEIFEGSAKIMMLNEEIIINESQEYYYDINRDNIKDVAITMEMLEGENGINLKIELLKSKKSYTKSIIILVGIIIVIILILATIIYFARKFYISKIKTNITFKTSRKPFLPKQPIITNRKSMCFISYLL